MLIYLNTSTNYASGAEYTKALNIPGLQRVLNMPVNMSAYTYICPNMPEYV